MCVHLTKNTKFATFNMNRHSFTYMYYVLFSCTQQKQTKSSVGNSPGSNNFAMGNCPLLHFFLGVGNCPLFALATMRNPLMEYPVQYPNINTGCPKKSLYTSICHCVTQTLITAVTSVEFRSNAAFAGHKNNHNLYRFFGTRDDGFV